MGLNISVAKVATDGALALDVFYVTESGHKLAPDRLPVVERALLERLRTESRPGFPSSV
jgi:UTP:GlnB (protein PII) uridylyltransferase